MHRSFYTYILLTVTLCISSILNAQSPSSIFDAENPNIKYLEHLIKVGIDEVRNDHALTSLSNDSILYLASNDHAAFLKEFGRLSHKQVNNRPKFTPQLRAEFYGAVNYTVGENIASMPFGTNVSMKSGKQISTITYGGIAAAFVEGWVNSPGHYQNIILPEYEITGVSIAIDNKKGIVYACQKFAYVELRFIFLENETMFPYSNYSPPPIASSFEGIPNSLIPKYKYPYKLRHDKLDKCAECPNQHEDAPDISLAYDERKGFVLRIENSTFVQKLIRNKFDGFAVELVDYSDYACGNGAYYDKPSRRNGQIRLNGILLEPKYRDDLLRGYKKRKKVKEMRFMNYIFRRDSVNFFKRFGQYKTDKYTSEYFEINLGKMPKNAPFLFNHNLIVIKDKQICDVYYFTSYCGDLYEAYKETAFIPFQYDDFNYGFKLSKDSIRFSVPFKQGEYDFDSEEILAHISSLSEYDFFIDSVNIHAYSSIEGDSTINANLQLKRGEIIAAIFQGIQDEEISKTINSSVNWNAFRQELRRSSETRHYNQLPNNDLKTKVDENPKQFEPQLASSRKGETTVYFHVIPNLKSLEYYIKKEFKDLDQQVKQHKRQRIDYAYYLNKMADLYRYTYAMVKKGYLDEAIFMHLPLPAYHEEHPHLIQYYLLFGIELNTVFSRIPNWQSDSSYYMEKYLNASKTELLPELNYMTLKLFSEQLIERKSMTEREYEHLDTKVETLKRYYQENELARTNMDKMNFNFNMLALNHFFKNSPKDQQHNAIMALAQVYEFYSNNELMYDTLALSLAKVATYYQYSDKGVDFVTPYQYTNDEALAFVNEVAYVHSSDPFSVFYYEKLIADFERMDTYTWCNMFIKPCGIPFQAFDYEALRVLFCKECVGMNEYLNRIYSGE
jgi:hypothetical protein